MKNIFIRYLIFIKERFNPIENILPIFIFYIGNISFSTILLNRSYQFDYSHIAAFILITLIFFHMRLFDEVKDYETDKIVHKERPLPRGLINLNEIGLLTLIVIFIEISIAFFFGYNAFVTYIILLSFTLLMRLEFFIGNFLKTKLTTYAVTHTFSSFFIGILSISCVHNISIFKMPLPIIIFSFANWFTFNIYEFARKSYAQEEEKKNIASYSKIFKPTGAFLLVFINVILTILFIILSIVFNNMQNKLLYFLLFLIIPFIISLFAGYMYINNKGKKSANLYRIIMSIYLISFYLFLFISSVLFKVFFL